MSDFQVKFLNNGMPVFADDPSRIWGGMAFTNARQAQHKPIEPIIVRRIPEAFTIEGDPRQYQAGDYVVLNQDPNKPQDPTKPYYRGMTAAEFAAEWTL